LHQEGPVHPHIKTSPDAARQVECCLTVILCRGAGCAWNLAAGLARSAGLTSRPRSCVPAGRTPSAGPCGSVSRERIAVSDTHAVWPSVQAPWGPLR
jgi:hypothetical protein